MDDTTLTQVFATDIAREANDLVGPWRYPRQMLAEQSYDDHASIHDDATAQKLGFKGGTIEGPTHFSQFVPLAVAFWGRRWLEQGCLSAHYRNPVYEGEKVRAKLTIASPKAEIGEITMFKEDGVEVLRGTASIGPNGSPTALESRLAELTPPVEPVILDGVSIGNRTSRQRLKMGFDQQMGHLYPFSLADKLCVITEPSPLYDSQAARPFPYGRAIIPVEMISVLLNHQAPEPPFYRKGPVVGLFADQEIRLFDGPLFVDEPYEIDREVVGLSGSRRTESLWVLTRVYRPGSAAVIASMLLNQAILKESYADYGLEHSRLYGRV